MIRLVLFDIDGTLIQTGGAGVQAFGRAFATEFNIPNGTERLKFSGRTDTGLARELFLQNEIEPSHENFRLFFDGYVFWLDCFLAQTRGFVLPGDPAYKPVVSRDVYTSALRIPAFVGSHTAPPRPGGT